MALLTVAVVTAVALAAGPSSRAQVQDPNDTRGLLDVRRVWFEPEVHPPRWTVVTYLPFAAEQTRDRGYVFVYLDTIGDEGFDYYAVILSNGRHLSGSLWREPKRGPDVRLMGLDVRHDSDTEVSVRIPFGQLDVGGFRTVYRWSVVTTFAGRNCRATCIDRVPDEGTFEQPIGTLTPTPRPDHDTDDDPDTDTHTDADVLPERRGAALSGIRLEPRPRRAARSRT